MNGGHKGNANPEESRTDKIALNRLRGVQAVKPGQKQQQPGQQGQADIGFTDQKTWKKAGQSAGQPEQREPETGIRPAPVQLSEHAG